VTGVVARCPACGEPIELEVDEQADEERRYVEDCSGCGRRLEVRVRVEAGALRVALRPAG
jgi:predicted RNA-binding Zn-ribbon protein involved in translation (DUF1610 family)